MKEQTLIIVKPDGVARGLVGEIISRLERKGFTIVAGKFCSVSVEKAENHYAEHKGKGFFQGLINFITSSPVMILVIEGNQAVASVRNLVGKTNGAESAPGTIRGDYGSSRAMNLIHASDSLPSAEREIANFFTSSEIVKNVRPDQHWLYEAGE
jgi:nucleoside-diphosphate kinase